MRLREKPLTPWIIAEIGGRILVGHCDCMAGLGETCSHIGTLLWAIEAGVRLRDSLTVSLRRKLTGSFQRLLKMFLMQKLRI